MIHHLKSCDNICEKMEAFIISSIILRWTTRIRNRAFEAHNEIKIFTKNNKLKSIMEKIIDMEHNRYIPPIYAVIDFHGQLQTIVQCLVRNCAIIIRKFLRIPIVKYDRELLILEDGGTIALDWAVQMTSCLSSREVLFDKNAIVILHHGLGGDSQSEYIIYQVKVLLSAGFNVCVWNSRGCGGVRLTSKSTFGGDRSKDMKDVIDYVKKKFNDESVPLFLLGFSLGGALSLSFIGLQGDKCPLTAAAIVSPPWNMKLRTTVFAWWSYVLAVPLKIYIYIHRQELSEHSKISLYQVMKCKTIDELDHLLIEGYGFNSVDEYRKSISPNRFVENIFVPTLSISAHDDPVCSIHGIPEINSFGPGLIVINAKYGGHLAFPRFSMIHADSWSENLIKDWFLEFII